MNHDLMVFIISLTLVPYIDMMIRVFFDKRRTSLPVYAASFLYYLILINVGSILRIPNAAPLIWITTYFVISLNYEGSWKKRIVAALLLHSIGGMVDWASMFFLGFSPIIGENVMHTNLSMMISTIAGFAMATLFLKLKNLRKNVSVSSAQQLFILIIPLSSTVLIYTIGAYSEMTTGAAFITGLIILGINIFIFYLYDSLTAAHEKNLKSALHEQEKLYYLTQCQLMQESMEQLKSVRHDMKTHLATVKGYSTKIKADEITNYLNSILSDIGESEVYSDTGNIAFDSIINFKLRNIKQDNIKLDMHLLVPSVVNVEVSDIATILGNLLDNALDAVANVEDKKIKLDIELSRESIFIQIENTFDGVVKYSEEANEDKRRIVTRKDSKNGDKHGHGLNNIKRSVEKYNGHMDINYTRDVFSVAILLYGG